MESNESKRTLIKCALFILFLKCVQCKISLDVSIDQNKEVLIVHSGFDENIIDDKDVSLFKIDKANLEQALNKHFGKVPDDFYLKTYKEDDVTRVLSIESVKIKNNERKHVIIKNLYLKNDSNKTMQINPSIRHTVENTLTIGWSNAEEYSQKFESNVNFVLAKDDGSTRFSYESKLGVGTNRSETSAIGSSSGLEIGLAPDQALNAVLSADVGILEIEVQYKMFLRGYVTCRFETPFRGQNFWKVPIQDVMASGGIENEETIYGTLRFDYYIDAPVQIFDKTTRRRLF